MEKQVTTQGNHVPEAPTMRLDEAMPHLGEAELVAELARMRQELALIKAQHSVQSSPAGASASVSPTPDTTQQRFLSAPLPNPI